MRRIALVAACACALVAAAREAWACGASAGGAAGIGGCSLSEHEEAARRRWRVGAAYAFTSTGLHFSGGPRVDEIRDASIVAVDYAPLPRLTLEAGAGPFLGGSLTAPAGRFALSPGLTSALGGSWRLVDAEGAIPFVLLNAQLSYVSSSADGAGYDALDLRFGAAIGTVLWRFLSPYVVGRAFGGPVYWRYQGAAVVGTDDHHWQAGAGISLRIGRRADMFVEGVPLGERGATAGVGLTL